MTTIAAELKPCGTYGAYQRHRKRGEPVDEACRKANGRYAKEYRARRPDVRERDRRYNTARHVALETLRRMHPAEFQRLFDEELAKAGAGVGA